MTQLNIKKVAIIGAGPAGICAAKYLHHNKHNDKKFDIVVFEKQDQVGGIWVYNKWDKSKPEKDRSPMYKDLMANLPRQVSSFPDFPFPEDTPSFPSAKVYLKYFQNYATHFNIDQFIKFNTEVTMVTPLIDEDTTVSEDGNDRFIKWKVQSKNIHSGETQEDIFDSVIVCNGLQWKANIPDIDGINNFKGKVLHSKYYDDPLEFKDKVVVIYGYGTSTVDIVRTIHNISSMIYISSYTKSVFNGNHPPNVKCVGDIIKVKENGEIEFAGDISVKADVLIYCTGYLNVYPSLSPQCKVDVTENGKLVSPIYKHLFHAIYPSLVIGSLAYFLPVVSFMHQQFAYVAAVLAGYSKLPSQTDMMNDINIEKENCIKSGKRLKFFHNLGANALTMGDEFAELSGSKKNPESMREAYLKLLKLAANNFYNYKVEYMKAFDLEK